MEKGQMVVGLVVVGLVLMTLTAEARLPPLKMALDMSQYISCKAMGNCRDAVEEAKKPMQQANPYTRGCSKIHRCRGGD